MQTTQPTRTTASAARYDRVELPRQDGTVRTLSRKEFEGLPLRERVACLIEGTARFFLGDLPVPPRDAMGSRYPMREFASAPSRVAALPPPAKALYTGFCILTTLGF